MRLAALAHPIRREIVERLSGGPASVGEVTRDFGVSKPTLSRLMASTSKVRR